VTGPGEVRVEVVGIYERPATGGEEGMRAPLLVLRDEAERELHLPIGSCEAVAIHLALSHQLVPRPLTHDLAVRLLEKLSATVGRVVIGGHPWDGYQAALHLDTPEGEVTLPAQPGDAIAIALRADAPVYVMGEVLSESGAQGS